MKKISVLVVEEHPVECEGIRMILASSTDVTLAGETTWGEAAIRALAWSSADVVLFAPFLARRDQPRDEPLLTLAFTRIFMHQL